MLHLTVEGGFQVTLREGQVPAADQVISIAPAGWWDAVRAFEDHCVPWAVPFGALTSDRDETARGLSAAQNAGTVPSAALRASHVPA